MMKNNNKLVNQKLDQICKLLNEVDSLEIKMTDTIVNKLENVKDWAKMILNG
jgi:hypothetical protein